MSDPTSDPEIRPGVRRLFDLALRRASRAREEADEEIRLHLQLRAEQLAREGLAPAAARAEAERRFGPLDEARRTLRGSAARREGTLRLREWWGGARQGVRVALRGLRRSPGFVAITVTCIALGVGANAAAFSLFDELVFRPLPVAEPERLVNYAAPTPGNRSDQCNQAGGCDEVFSYPMFRDLERARPGVTAVAGHRLFIATLAHGGRATDGTGEFVSGAYFPVLGLRPARGRLLGPADDRAPGASPVVVVSHAYWTSQLGGDPDVVGRQLRVNGRSLTVVGVAPAGFEGTTLGMRPRVYVPLSMVADVDPFFGPRARFEDRRQYWIYAFARLRPGVTLAQAGLAANAVYRPIVRDVEAPLQQGMSAATRQRFRESTVRVTDGRHGQSALRGTTRTPMTLLLGITGLVVLIASANIANLLLARGLGRGTEIAVRMSLGAGRRRLVAQLLTEACVIAALGGAASLLVARGTLRIAAALIPRASLGMAPALSLELRPSVLAFAAAVALGTGVLFGLFPALHATRPDLIASIRAGAGQIAGGHRAAARFRTTLVTAQIALSMALLVSAGLFIKSLRNIGRVDLGMDVAPVVTFGLLPELSGYGRERARALLARVETSMRALPGVTEAAASSTPLLTGSSNGGNVRVEGFVRTPDTDAGVRMNQAGPGYFRALGIPLLAGREFTEADRLDAPRVAVVNQAFARKFGLGRNPVGRRLAIDGVSPENALDVEIVGLARDARYADVKQEVPPMVVTPWRQDSVTAAAVFYVRGGGSPAQLLRMVPAAVAALDPDLPVLLLKTMPQQVRESVYLDRMIGTLSAMFAALATLLAAVGLYGVLAYMVAQRRREFGVRMALGADARHVRALVLRQVARMVVVGGVIGVAAALGLGRLAQSLLFGLQGHDPAVALSAALVLGAVALGAGYVPAWRASRVDPMGALRSD